MKQHILVIEDNPADAAIIRIYLEEASFGHKIHQADSLKGGFKILNETDIDIVLLDLSLTDSVGFSTLEKFLAAFPQVPVIVMTGLKNDIVGVQCVRAGAQDFLVKGEFDGRGLVKSIRHSMQRFQTQTKLRESALKLSIQQNRIQEAQELAQFANWEMDMVTNSMKWGNEMYRIFGIPSQAAPLSLSDYLQHVYFDDKEKVESFFAQAMKDEEVHKIEHRIIVNNRVKHLAVRAKVHFDQASEQLLLIGSAQDVSEQVAGSAAPSSPVPDSETWTRELLTALGTHIHKSIFDVLGLAHLMVKTASPAQHDLITEFRHDMTELWLSVHNLLCTQTGTTGRSDTDTTSFSSSAMFQNFSDWAEAEARKNNTELKLHIGSDVPATLSGDEISLSLVLFNTFRFFVQEGQASRSIHIQCKLDRGQSGEAFLSLKFTPGQKLLPADALHTALNNPDPELSVPSELKNQVTVPAVAARLIQSLKGRFLITADKKGMCESLEIALPVRIPSDPSPVAPASEKAPKGPHILLVDDHALHRIAGRSVLQSAIPEVRVELAESGAVALDEIRRKSFAVVFLDLQMPQMDGFATLAELKKRSQVPVVAVSPAPHPEEEARCMAAGFTGYTGKPLQPDAVKSQIFRMLGL